jgi:hypothetical protein
LPKLRIIIIFAIISLILFSFLAFVFLNEMNQKNPSTAQVVWLKNYGGAKDDRAFYAVANDQGYLAIGSTKSIIQNTTTGWVLQLDPEGNVIWNRTYLQGEGTELRYAIDLADGYLFVGNEYLEGADVNGFVLRTDEQGNELWNTTIGGNNVDKLFSAIQAPDGFVLLGTTYLNENNYSVAWAAKIDVNGEILWNNEYLNGTDSTIRQGILAPDGNYICAGYAKVGDYQFLTLKIDTSGKLIWNQTYGQESSQKAYSIAKAADGYIIAGDKVSLQSDSDAWLIKLDWNGTILWEKAIGGNDADSAAAITPSEDGNYLVTGFTFSYGKGNRDVWLLKVSNEGNLLWSCTAGDVGYQEAYQVLDAGKNQYVIVGWTDPPEAPDLIGKAQYNFYTAKLSP